MRARSSYHYVQMSLPERAIEQQCVRNSTDRSHCTPTVLQIEKNSAYLNLEHCRWLGRSLQSILVV